MAYRYGSPAAASRPGENVGREDQAARSTQGTEGERQLCSSSGRGGGERGGG